MNTPDSVAIPSAGAPIAGEWMVYIIRASDDSLYTGITTDIERRWQQHRDGRGGAKFFRGRSPQALVLVEAGHDRASASKREAAIKRLTRSEKLALIAQSDPPKETASTRLAVEAET